MDKKSVFFIVLSFAILAVMLYLVGINQIIATLKTANPTMILAAIGVQILVYILYTLRWKSFVHMANINVGFRQLLPMTMVGLAVNNITPSGREGGGPVRAYILSKESDSKLKNTFATVMADRMMDLIAFVVLAVITLSVTIFKFQMAHWFAFILVAAVIAITIIICLLTYLCLKPHFGYRFEKFILRIVRRVYKKGSPNMEASMHENILGFRKAMRVLLTTRKTFYWCLPLSFLIWALEIFRVFLVFSAFGPTLNFEGIGEVFIIATLVGMIPLLPGGLGTVDGTMIRFYSKAGIAVSLAAPVTIIERLISFWMTSIIGFMILPHYGSSVLDKNSIKTSAEELDKSSEEGESL